MRRIILFNILNDVIISHIMLQINKIMEMEVLIKVPGLVGLGIGLQFPPLGSGC